MGGGFGQAERTAAKIPARAVSKLDIQPPAIELGQRDQEIGQRGPLAAKRLLELLHQIMCREIAHELGCITGADGLIKRVRARSKARKQAARGPRPPTKPMPGAASPCASGVKFRGGRARRANSCKAASMTWRTPAKKRRRKMAVPRVA